MSQLDKLFNTEPFDIHFVKERIDAAYNYFFAQMDSIVYDVLWKIEEVKRIKKAKILFDELSVLEEAQINAVFKLMKAKLLVKTIASGEIISKENLTSKEIKSYKIDKIEAILAECNDKKTGPRNSTCNCKLNSEAKFHSGSFVTSDPLRSSKLRTSLASTLTTCSSNRGTTFRRPIQAPLFASLMGLGDTDRTDQCKAKQKRCTALDRLRQRSSDRLRSLAKHSSACSADRSEELPHRSLAHLASLLDHHHRRRLNMPVWRIVRLSKS